MVSQCHGSTAPGVRQLMGNNQSAWFTGISGDTKAIIVNDERSWKPKVEKGNEKKRKAGMENSEDGVREGQGRTECRE